MAKIINTIIGDDIKVGDVISVLRINESILVNGVLDCSRSMVINSGVVESVSFGCRANVVLRTDDGHVINYAFNRSQDATLVYQDYMLIAKLYIFSGIINLTQS